MNLRRIAGFVMIILAAILTLAIVGQLPQLFRSVAGFVMMISGKLDSTQSGEATGHIIYWAFHFTITVVLWRYGIRLSRKLPKV